MFVNCCASLDDGGPCIGYANDLKTKNLLEMATYGYESSIRFEVYAPLPELYIYTDVDGCYGLTLTDAFKAEVNKAGQGEFTASNGYVWHTGDALPNPAPDGMYHRKQVVILTKTFYDYSSMTNLDISKWDTRNVTDMISIFEASYSGSAYYILIRE